MSLCYLNMALACISQQEYRMTPEALKARNNRNVAIAFSILALMAVIFIATVAKYLGAQ